MALVPDSQQDQQKLLIGLIPILLLFAYWYFMHSNATAEVAQLETRLETLESRNAQARAVANRAGPDLQERLAVYEQHIGRLEELIPRSEEVSELLYSMAQRAQETDVELDMVRPDVSETGTYYRRETYSIRVTGGFHEIGRFLTSVGSLRRIITPIDLSLQPWDGAPQDGAALQANFRIETYVVPESVPAEGEEAADDTRA